MLQDDNSGYEILEKLGSGAFGTVYRALRKADGCEFAIKVVNKNNLTHENFERLMEETKILSSLTNTNIIKFIEANIIKDQFYIVLELANDGSLYNLMQKKENHFSDEEASQIMKSLLTAVKYIHEKNIVHRDIKPANILVKNSNDFSTVKLSDFGISAIISDYSSNYFTQCCGTPLYMAPEFFNHEIYSKPVDIWSCGIVTYWLLTGHHPYNANSKEELAAKIQTCEWSFPENISNLAKDFFSKLVCKNPDSRYNASQALTHPWITRKSETEIPLTFAQKIHVFNKENDIFNLMNGVLFCLTLKKYFTNLQFAQNNKHIIQTKNNMRKQLEKKQSKSETEIPSQQEKEKNQKTENKKEFRIHICPSQNSNNEIKSNPNLRSCNNLQALISPKKNLEKITEFKIKLKKSKELTSSNKTFQILNSEESDSAKTRPIDFSKNNQRNEFSNTKTRISNNSTSKSISFKNDSMEENTYLEKAKRKLPTNPKPPLGTFRSPSHKKGFGNEYRASFVDLKKLQNHEEERLNNKWKKMQSSNNLDLDCSLDEMISSDEDDLKDGRIFNQKFGSTNSLEHRVVMMANNQMKQPSNFIGRKFTIHRKTLKI